MCPTFKRENLHQQACVSCRNRWINEKTFSTEKLVLRLWAFGILGTSWEKVKSFLMQFCGGLVYPLMNGVLRQIGWFIFGRRAFRGLKRQRNPFGSQFRDFFKSFPSNAKETYSLSSSLPLFPVNSALVNFMNFNTLKSLYEFHELGLFKIIWISNEKAVYAENARKFFPFDSCRFLLKIWRCKQCRMFFLSSYF